MKGWPAARTSCDLRNCSIPQSCVRYEIHEAADREQQQPEGKDRQALLAFYDFPAEHWKHLRTSNPIESTFATVRHRTIRSKGCLSNKTALAMVFKLVDAAQKSWRRLDGHNQLPKLIQGVRFTDGIEVAANPASSQSQTAAA
jgi:putative transposase